jgi:hypothetical protein
MLYLVYLTILIERYEPVADKHPYAPSIDALKQVIEHLKKSFPNTLTADVLKKLSLAPNTESRIINVLRFLGLLDEDNGRTAVAQRAFTLHDQNEFQNAFADIVQGAYKELFSLYGDGAWNLEQARLITFFRQTDQSTERVGTEQARTFKTLAGYAGHGETIPVPKPRVTSRQEKQTKPPKIKPNSDGNAVKSGLPESKTSVPVSEQLPARLGLTVRIEINLPVADDQETYDRIFKSIRENLLNGG